MSSINFDNPYLLLLAIPVAALIIVPFVLAVRKENSNWHNIASSAIHVLMAIIIAFTAAGTTIETVITETDVYVLADVSYSSHKNFDAIDTYIEELHDNLPKGSRMGVVCFAGDQQLYVKLGGKIRSVDGADLDLVNDGQTDIEGALDYVEGLFRDDVIKRVVVITDGKQTRLDNSNVLKNKVEDLRANGVYVDAVYLDNNISSNAKEVQIDSADVTQNTYLNKSETAEITVQSTYETQAAFTLTCNGSIVASKTQQLQVGYNTVKFTLSTAQRGVYDYTVSVSADGDESAYNNTLSFSQSVSDAVNVLLIADSASENYLSDRMDFERAYSGATLDVVTTEEPKALPRSVEELCAYDEIILSDVDLTSFSNYGTFISSLDIVVSSLGKSLTTYGNVRIQDKSELTALGDLLPINYGNAGGDEKLYTIVVDASYSMDSTSRFILAKQAAKQLVSSLGVNDAVMVALFNGNYELVVMPTIISDKVADGEEYSPREQVLAAIDGMRTDHSTVLSFGLQEAVSRMEKLPQKQKQIMLISDGMTVSGSEEESKITAQLERMNTLGIVTSVMDVGRNNDTSSLSEKAEELLKKIALSTGGKYFFASNEEELEEVMFGQGLLEDVNKTFIDGGHINLVKSYDAVLDGVDLTDSEHDYVTGYYYNTAKSSTTVVMTAMYEREGLGTIENVPLYAYWNYGNGRVSSLSCGLEHTASWLFEARERFTENVYTTCIPSEKVSCPFITETLSEDGYLSVTITPAKIDTRVTAKITVTAPDGSSTEADMAFTSSAYTYRFATYDVGKYDVKIEYVRAGGDKYSSDFSYTVSYLSEYDSFAAFDVATVYKMIGADGEVMQEGDDIVVKYDESLISTYILDLTIPLLITCVALFVADVVIRKLKWEDIRSLFGKRKK